MCKILFVTFNLRQVLFSPRQTITNEIKPDRIFLWLYHEYKNNKKYNQCRHILWLWYQWSEFFSDQTDTKFWPILSFKLAKNSHNFFYQLTIWFVKEELHYVWNNFCCDDWQVLLDSSRFPRFIQALARVSLHIPRACPRDMQGYEG